MNYDKLYWMFPERFHDAFIEVWGMPYVVIPSAVLDIRCKTSRVPNDRPSDCDAFYGSGKIR